MTLDSLARAGSERIETRKIGNRKALSPVIATVILVAVAITVAVAVAYWMGGIAGQYTKFEKIEIQSGICVWNQSQDYWDITLKLKNTGTAAATLIGVFINEIEVNDYADVDPADGEAVTDMNATQTVTSGSTSTIHIYVDGIGGTTQWQTVTAGTTVNIKVHSAGGMDYIKLIELV